MKWAFVLLVFLAIAVAPSQAGPFLLVSGYSSDNVVRFDAATGAFVDVFITAGSGGLVHPEGITFGPDGSLFVAGYYSSAVLRYDGSSGAFLGALPSLNSPVGLAVRGNELFVSSNNDSSVVRYNATTGEFLGTFVTSGSGGLDHAHGIAFGPDGNLYVSSNSGGQVLRYDGTDGHFLGVAAQGHGLVLPTDLTFGPDAKLYVSSDSVAVLGDSVLRFDGQTGTFLDTFIPRQSGGLMRPHGLVFDGDGQAYVASYGTSQILRYDGSSGSFVDVFAADAALKDPTYMVLTSSAVPEPSTLTLAALGGIGMLGYLRWRTRA